MSTAAIAVDTLAFVCLVLALATDRLRAKRALAAAWKSFVRILPTVLLIVVLIGLLLAFAPPAFVARLLGRQSGFGGLLAAAALGTVLHIPSLLSFPLAASLLQSGASVATVAAFITTLTMIGVVTLPLEIRELGRTMALLRNGLSFFAALAIALLMGVILS